MRYEKASGGGRTRFWTFIQAGVKPRRSGRGYQPVSPIGLILLRPMGSTVRPRKTSCTASAGGMPRGCKVVRWKPWPSGRGGFHAGCHGLDLEATARKARTYPIRCGILVASATPHPWQDAKGHHPALSSPDSKQTTGADATLSDRFPIPSALPTKSSPLGLSPIGLASGSRPLRQLALAPFPRFRATCVVKPNRQARSVQTDSMTSPKSHPNA